MLRKYASIILVPLFSISSLSAQVLKNMVKNPSFEVYTKVPKDLGELSKVKNWSTPTKASPDYFHRRAASPTVDIPLNKMGNTPARTGYAYAGFYAYTSRYIKRNFREYVQVQLKQPLNRNEKYCVKLHVYLAQSSNRAIKELGITFRKSNFEHEHEKNIETEFVALAQEGSEDYLNKRDWIEISAVYKAKGGETELLIGNFLDDRNTEIKQAKVDKAFENKNVDFAYYFIDDVCVTNKRTNFTCDCGSFEYAKNAYEQRIVLDTRLQRIQYKVGQTIILKQVDFDHNKSSLLSSSNKELDKLVGVLKLNPNYQIEISGHTSNKGDSQKNYSLSLERAKSVANYLLASGIDEDRMKTRGYGESRPIRLNNKLEGRKTNERIEILLLKK